MSGAREALGDTGAVVPVEDPEALASALAERLLDPAKADEEGRRARARAEERHDIRRAYAALADLYDEISSSRASGNP